MEGSEAKASGWGSSFGDHKTRRPDRFGTIGPHPIVALKVGDLLHFRMTLENWVSCPGGCEAEIRTAITEDCLIGLRCTGCGRRIEVPPDEASLRRPYA